MVQVRKHEVRSSLLRVTAASEWEFALACQEYPQPNNNYLLGRTTDRATELSLTCRDSAARLYRRPELSSPGNVVVS